MCKLFAKYFLIIMVITVSVTLFGNFFIQTEYAKINAQKSGLDITQEILERMESNDDEIARLVSSLNENYIARAHAVGEIIDQNPEVLEKGLAEMQRLADVLNVNEIHIIDADGILKWGNIPEYYGLNFYETDQTREFIPGLTDKSFALAQDPQPNGIEGKMFQYISVARQAKPGIVQVGVMPEVLENALSDNTISKVISDYNVNSGTNIIVFDSQKNIVADSKSELIGKTSAEINAIDSNLSGQDGAGFINRNGDKLFCVYAPLGEYTVEISFNENALFVTRNNQTFTAFISSLLLGLTIVVAIYYLLKKKIVYDIEKIGVGLKQITQGDLDVVVQAGRTPELAAQSESINEMTASLKRQMNKIEAQSNELEENHINIMASLNYARKIQNNLLPPNKYFENTFKDYSILWEPRDTVGGDIYWMNEFDDGAVLCVCDCTGHGTPGALLTMLVATALDTIVTKDNHGDTAQIMWQLENRLVSTLNVTSIGEGSTINDGADLMIMFIPKEGDITLSSAKLHIFICDGEKVEVIKGQKLSIGDGSLKSKEQVETITVKRTQGSCCYIASDGIFDQIGGEQHLPFGYNRFKKIIIENHDKAQSEIRDITWQIFKTYMGDEGRRDDVTVVGFKL